jgi:hypothetical protein
LCARGFGFAGLVGFVFFAGFVSFLVEAVFFVANLNYSVFLLSGSLA